MHSSLSDAQDRVVRSIGAWCAQRAVPAQAALDDAEDQATAVADGAGAGPAEAAQAGPQRHIDGAVLHNSSQFYRWHSELQAARTLEREEKYRLYGEALRGQLEACDALTALVADTVRLLGLLGEQHQTVNAKTRALSTSCERLTAEQARLVQFAAALRSRLGYFDELERVAGRFHSPALAVDSEQFPPLLHRLDECLAYVAAHPKYADAAVYAGKFRQLQARALGTVRICVQQALRQAADQVQAGLRQARAQGAQQQQAGGPGAAGQGAPQAGPGGREGRSGAPALQGQGGPLPEGSETALLYVRFRAAVEAGVKGVLTRIAAGATKTVHTQLLADCQRLYCEVRLPLVKGIISERIAGLSTLPLPTFMRAATSYMAEVCQAEQQLFEQCLPAAAPGAAQTQAVLDGPEPLLDPLCSTLYDLIRSACIQLRDLDTLCEVTNILQHECLGGDSVWRSRAVSAHLHPALQRALADVQGRLTFQAQAFIKEDVRNFTPAPEDLAYPECLQGSSPGPQPAAPAASSQEAGEIQPAQENGHGPAPAAAPQAEGTAPPQWDAGWYPPVRAVLHCLSRLYSCVGRPVFAGLAQEAVVACAAAVQAGSQAVTRRSGLIDGQLFLIKQLLVLREHIAPFEADFSVKEKDLDFSHMRDHLKRIYSGRASLFTLSAENAVLQFLSQGAPRVLESQVDGKKDVEQLLKSTCEAFILTVTRQTVEPLLTFITKVTAVRVAAASGGAAKSLREQAFAAPDKLGAVVARVRTALAAALPQAVAKMQLYLHNPATHGILFRPIKANIAEAFGQIGALLGSEYTAEEAAGVGLPSPADLKALLDGLS